MISFTSKWSWFEGGAGKGGMRRRKDFVHAALDSQIIKDTNLYVPMRTGMLASSPARSSKVGEIVYDTPYAKKQYYNDGATFNRSLHPHAGPRWLERSKAIWLPKWIELVRKLLGVVP